MSFFENFGENFGKNLAKARETSMLLHEEAWELVLKLLGRTEIIWKLLGYEGTVLLIGPKHPSLVSDWPETTEKTTGKRINTEACPCWFSLSLYGPLISK